MWNVPVLSGEMVQLRPIEARDAEALWISVHDPEGSRLTGTSRIFRRPEIDDWASSVASLPGRFDWALTSPMATPEAPADQLPMIGEITLVDVDEKVRSATLRSSSLPGHRGRGYGREAAMLVLRFAFEELELHRVGLEVLGINPRAAALYSSLGFVTEGRLRDAHLDGERRTDVIMMGMIIDDYHSAQSNWQ